MPLGGKPMCVECHATESSLWEKTKSGDIQCSKCFSVNAKRLSVNLSGSNICFPLELAKPITTMASSVTAAVDSLGENNVKVSEIMTDDMAENDIDSEQKILNRSASYSIRKSSRIKPTKLKPPPPVKTLATKGRGRRIIFKRNPLKAPPAIATVVTKDYIFHDGSYWQVGDIVSLLDVDGGTYYAQLRGFLQDQYLEKSAVITWLIPVGPTDPLRFCPDDYRIGPEEDIPRKIEYFEFVCHAPSNYYRNMRAPYRSRASQPELGFIWTRVGPQIRPLSSMPDITASASETFDEEEDNSPSIKNTESAESKKDGDNKKTKEKDCLPKGGTTKKHLPVKEKVKEKLTRI